MKPSAVTTAVADAPLGRDSLNITSYVQGLSGFIQTCQTPMTVAVQGDWGTGKTNMMMLVERELAPHGHFRLSDPPQAAPEHATAQHRVYTIRFNTWQYSQLSMQDRLVGSMLENIGAHLLLADVSERATEKRKDFLKSLLPVASAGGIGILKAGLGLVGMGALTQVVDEIREADDVRRRSSSAADPSGDAATLLIEAKSRFAAAVDELVAGPGEEPGRVVIFIDDLDRLEPRKAVELMESLKLFLDVPHCVFVLAIDFAVVEQGVSAKYGAAMDRVKARSFFDKIIQVPFQMPTGAYQIDQLLIELTTQTGIELIGDADRAAFLTLITYSIGSNPRSIKRLINTFVLLRSIAAIAGATGGEKISDVQLFAILCLQTAYPDAYLEIVSAEPYSESELYQHFFRIDDEHREPLAPEVLQKQGIEPGAVRFTTLARAVVDQFGGADGVDEAQLERALKQAMTTSSGAEAVATPTRRGEKVYAHDERHARLASKTGWRDVKRSLRIPDVISERLERNPRVRVGTPPGDVQGWVIEVDGKRRGMMLINQSKCHLVLEPRHFHSPDKRSFLHAFAEAFPQLAPRVRSDADSGWFQVRDLRRGETELAAQLGDFWLKLIEDDLEPTR